MNKLLKKIVAVLLLINMLSASLSTIGIYGITYALENSKLTNQDATTQHANVEFNSYFENGEHSLASDIEQTAKLLINVKVKEAGYLKNGVITFENTNFEICKFENENIQKIENNKILLKQLDCGTDITIEIPIKILKGEKVSIDNFSKEATTNFSATYIDGNGKTKNISKQIINELSWTGTVEAEVKTELTKYIPYSIEENKGILLQAKINSKIKENKLPIKTTELEIQAPEINGLKPTSVNVIAIKTMATNGKEDGTSFNTQNYSYDINTGVLTIKVENNLDEISWAQKAQDEYLVTFTFNGEEIYNYVITDGIDTNIKVKGNIKVYGGVEEGINIQQEEIKIEENEKLGEILDLKIDSTDSLNKGQMYANDDAENKKEVEYIAKYTLTICNVNLTDKIEINQEIEKITTIDEEEEQPTNAENSNIYNKRIKISKEVFNKILGEEGLIEIYDLSKVKIGEINKETTVEDENYVLDISENNNSQLIISTTKPILEGQLIINIEKAVKTEISYTKNELKDLEEIYTQIEGKVANTKVKALKTIALQEPTSVANIELNKTNLSTVIKNENVQIKATLDTSSENQALYKNPTLKIKFPSYIKEVKLNNYNLIMSNGLEIKGEPQVVKEDGALVIKVDLEGTQTEYTIGAEYKGTIVILDTDITVETLTPTNKNKLILEFTNENEVSTNNKGTVEANLNFVAPEGVVAANGISNYAEGKSSIISISDEGAIATIDAYGEKRTATVSGKIINNYENNIKDVVILGRIPAKGNKTTDLASDLGSTFSTTLTSKVVLNGIEASKYTVYYSSNANATKDLESAENNWSTTPTASTKSYMITINDYEVKASDVLEIVYNIEIPENIAPSNSSYEMYQVFYTNMSSIGNLKETKKSSIIGIATEKGPELSVELTSDMQNVKEGQIVKMYVTVKNTGTETANNVKVNIPLPEKTVFVDYEAASGFYKNDENAKTIEVGTIEAGKSETVSYHIKFIDYMIDDIGHENEESITEEEYENNIEDNKFPKEIINKVNVSVNNLKNTIPSNEYKFEVQDGKIQLEMIGRIEETEVLRKGDILKTIIKSKNISHIEELKDVIITIPLPQEIKYKKAIIKDQWSDDDSEATTEGIEYDEKTNTVKIKVDQLEFMKTIILDAEIVEDFEGNFELMAIGTINNNEEHYSNILKYEAAKVDIEVSKLKSTPKYIKDGEEVTYRLDITNKGKGIVNNIIVTDKLPKELTFVEATYTRGERKEKITTLINEEVAINVSRLRPKETTTIEITAQARLLTDKNEKKIENKMNVTATNFDKFETNTVINIIEYNQKIHDEIKKIEDMKNIEEKNTEKDINSDIENNDIAKYKITGTAWIDENKNGIKEESENVLSNVQVMLIYKSNNKVVRDLITNDKKITTTNKNGQYQFDNLVNGEYLVIFVYDSAKYSITTYKKEQIDETINSDAINITIVLDGEKRVAGISDVINIQDENARDIDIGLYVSEKFDLRLDKYITKTTLTTPTIGTKATTYDNKQIAKVEVLSKNLDKSSVVIEYKIVVTNEGAVPGYAKKIVDYLPEGVVFNTELNKDWYLSNNGNIYNTSLENTIINPGESKELTLIIVKQITESSIGILNNNAEIYESYNEQGLKDIDSIEANKVTNEDDISKADLVLGIVTGGQIVIYTALALTVITLLGFGIFEIKKRVLNKRNV